MALTISTPYKTNTLASISGTRFISNGSPAFSGTTGRFIVMLDGPAAGQIRRVAATPAANEVTLDYPFSSGPFASLGFAEVDPVAGNTWVMSYQLEDIVDGTNVILANGRIYIPFGNQVTFASGTFLAQVQKNFTFDSNSFLISNGAYCQFGHVSEAGNPYSGCYLEDTAGGSTGGFGGSSGSGGDCRFYACAIKCSTSDFWRLYRDSNSKHHLVGCLITGNFGARVRGTRSIILNNTVDNDTSLIGPFHPATPVGLVSGLRVVKGQAGAYLNYGWPDALVKGLSTSEVSYYVQCAQVASGTNASMYFEDFKQAEVEACTLGAVRKSDGFDSPLALVKFSNYIDTAIVDTSLAPITALARRVIRNAAPATISDTTTTSGAFAKYVALRKTFNLAGTAARNIPWSEGVEEGPFVSGLAAYGYVPSSVALTLATSSNLTTTLLADAMITESAVATVAAYTELETLAKVYDFSAYWLTQAADNMVAAGLGNRLLSYSGGVLDCGSLNVVIDATAASVFSLDAGTLTIKAPTLSGTKIQTTGTISFANGAAPGQALIYADSTGTSVPILVGGIRNGTKCRIVRTDTEAELAIGIAGAAGFVARVSWTTDLPIRADTTFTSGVDCEQEASALGTLTANGALLTVTQEPCTIYELNNIDGDAVTGLTLDAPNVEVDADEVDNRMAVQEFFAWYKSELMTDAGIRTLFGAITAENAHKYRVNASKCPLKIDQKDLVNSLLFTGGLIYRDDGESIRLAGSGSIEMIPDDVYESAAAERDITAIRNLVEADEVHTPTAIQKRQRGTATVLLEKAWTGKPLTDFAAVDP